MTLVFVYNANSGAVNAVLDSMHKIIDPSTYDCKLCELTYGLFTENPKWKKFRAESDLEMRFLHKDEFRKQYRSKWLPKYELPVVLILSEQEMEIFISASELASLDSTEALISLVEERITLH